MARVESATSVEFDCRTCGACCANLPSNRAEGFVSWVEIADDDRIFTRADLVRKHVVRDADNVPHLRLAADGRCLALRGALGRDVSCTIYHHRPSPCRRVQPGDASCLRYRREHEFGVAIGCR
jgi:Fe-S-cluster containining protein